MFRVVVVAARAQRSLNLIQHLMNVHPCKGLHIARITAALPLDEIRYRTSPKHTLINDRRIKSNSRMD